MYSKIISFSLIRTLLQYMVTIQQHIINNEEIFTQKPSNSIPTTSNVRTGVTLAIQHKPIT